MIVETVEIFVATTEMTIETRAWIVELPPVIAGVAERIARCRALLIEPMRRFVSLTETRSGVQENKFQ
jgi:hypothetical protein